MNGPEHYAEAERLLLLTNLGPDQYRDGTQSILAILAEAQVHATLAQTAVLAEAAGLTKDRTTGGFDVPERTEPSPWGAVVGSPQ